MALRTAAVLRNRGLVEIRTRGLECIKNPAIGFVRAEALHRVWRPNYNAALPHSLHRLDVTSRRRALVPPGFAPDRKRR